MIWPSPFSTYIRVQLAPPIFDFDFVPSIHIRIVVRPKQRRSTATKQAKMFSVATATLRRTVTKSPNAYTFVCRSVSSLPETMKVSQIRPRSV